MQDLYQRHFRYDSETGQLFHVTSKGRVRAGQEVTAKDAHGYIRVQFQRKKILGHRLAWELYYGETAPEFIDHINGDVSDNRIINLRPATHGQNQHNRAKYSNNKTGIKGISTCHGGYQATIAAEGKTHTKWSKDIDIAIKWLLNKRIELHGTYAHD